MPKRKKAQPTRNARVTKRLRSESPALEGAYVSDLASNPPRPLAGQDAIYAPLPDAPGTKPHILSVATSSELLAPAPDRCPPNSFYKTKEYWDEDYLQISSDEFLTRIPDPDDVNDDFYIKREELPARQFIDVLGCDPPPPGWFGPRAYMIFAKDKTKNGLRQVKDLLLNSKVDRQKFYVDEYGWVVAMLSEEQRDFVRLSSIVRNS